MDRIDKKYMVQNIIQFALRGLNLKWGLGGAEPLRDINNSFPPNMFNQVTIKD